MKTPLVAEKPDKLPMKLCNASPRALFEPSHVLGLPARRV